MEAFAFVCLLCVTLKGICCDPLTSPTPQAELMPAIPRVLEVAEGCRASSDVQSQALMFIAAVSFPEENKVQLHTLVSCTCGTKGPVKGYLPLASPFCPSSLQLPPIPLSPPVTLQSQP